MGPIESQRKKNFAKRFTRKKVNPSRLCCAGTSKGNRANSHKWVSCSINFILAYRLSFLTSIHMHMAHKQLESRTLVPCRHLSAICGRCASEINYLIIIVFNSARGPMSSFHQFDSCTWPLWQPITYQVTHHHPYDEWVSDGHSWLSCVVVETMHAFMLMRMSMDF